MKLWFKAFFVVFQTLAACSHAANIPEVSLGSAPAETMVLPYLQVVAQPANTDINWGPQDAWQAAERGQILLLAEQRKPYRSPLVHWAVTRLTHHSSETDWVLYYRLAAMENIQVFARAGGGDWLPLKGLHQQSQFLTGYHFPSFALRMPQGEAVDFAVRVQTRAPIDMHLIAVPAYPFYEAQRSDLVISGMVLAVPLVVLLYLVLLLPKNSHLGLGWFIAMIVLETIGSMWISGHGQVLMPMIDRKDWPAVGYISYSLLVLVSWLHGQRFVAAAPLSLGVRVLGWSVVAIVAGCTVVELMKWANVRDVIPAGLLIFSCLMALVGLRAMRHRIAYAGYYTLAWLAFVAPAVVLAFNLLGIWSMSGSNIYYVQSSVAAILFGLLAVGHIRAREQVLMKAQQESQQLAHTKDQLEEALAVRLRFFAATNHDLRQPLQAMSIYLDLATQQAPAQGSDKLRVYLTEAKAANSSVSHFLDSLMDLARIESKVLHPQAVQVNFMPMLTQLVHEHQPLAGRVGLELRYVLPDQAYTQTDPRLLERIVRNLLSNAIRYTREGGILLALRKSAGQWKLQIYDTGVGFRDSDMERLFQPFSSTEEHLAQFHASSGLGLFVVKSFAEALGHTTQLKTREGKGSCFSVILPKLDPVDGASDSMLPTTFANGLASLSAWVLDDERDVGEALLAMMQDAGAEVTLFQSPQQIDAAIANLPHRPQLLLADFNLGQGGLLTEHMHRWQQVLACPIVALTGSMRLEVQQALLASGVREVLAKPVSIDALTLAVNRALRAPPN